MISTLTLQYCIKSEEPGTMGRDLRMSLGSIFHALFLEDLATRNPALFETLHSKNNHIRPYKITWPRYEKIEGQDFFVWRLHALNEEISEYLMQWAESPTQEIISRQLNKTLTYDSHTFEEEISYSQFTKRYYQPGYSPPEKLTLVFDSPATFNWAANGDYIPMPDPKLILSGLYLKWNTFSRQYSMEDDEILGHFLASVRIRSANVFPQPVLVNRHIIPCFRGSLELSFSRKTPLPMRQLLMMLLYYAEFSGVGAKTAMGMGDIRILNHPDRLFHHKSNDSIAGVTQHSVEFVEGQSNQLCIVE